MSPRARATLSVFALFAVSPVIAAPHPSLQLPVIMHFTETDPFRARVKLGCHVKDDEFLASGASSFRMDRNAHHVWTLI